MFALQFNQLDRQGEIRQDQEKIAALINHPKAQFIGVFEQQLAITENLNLNWLSLEKLQNQVGKLESKHLIYLGKVEQTPYFSYRIKNPQQLENGEFSGLRALLKGLSPEQAYLANCAIAIEHWHNSHQHCGFCGAETYSAHAGFMRQCSNQECGKEHFPRTDPAIICAISANIDGEDKILLGRQAHWPEYQYSVIAGFVEPGESLEQAVVREAFEETGISVENVKYFASQPWPFPQSLMVGFTAQATSFAIDLKDKELENANWFSRHQIQQLLANEQLKLPNSASISRALIEHWRQLF